MFNESKKRSYMKDIDKGWTKESCSHPEHNPPSHIVIPYGKELHHICPGCGKETVVQSSQIRW